MGKFDSLQCHYCYLNVDKDNVVSLWEEDLHYVEFTCGCGKHNLVRVDLLGGFDPTQFFQKSVEVISSRTVVRGKEMT